MNIRRRGLATRFSGAGVAAMLMVGVVAGPFGATPAQAAARPSATIVLNCTSNVNYTFWPTQAPAINVSFYNSAGVIQEMSVDIYCPNGGGRTRYKTYLLGKWPQISVACFRYTGDGITGGTIPGYEIGETETMSRPASGTCTDDGQSGQPNLGTFATWTVNR